VCRIVAATAEQCHFFWLVFFFCVRGGGQVFPSSFDRAWACPAAASGEALDPTVWAGDDVALQDAPVWPS